MEATLLIDVTIWLFNTALFSLPGTIPSEIGGLKALASLRLASNNAICGTMPSDVGSLSGPRDLFRNSNAMSGSTAVFHQRLEN